jgi:hypothetical protein
MVDTEEGLLSLTKRVSELCALSRLEGRVEPLYRAAIEIASEVPRGENAATFSWFASRLQKTFKDKEPLLYELVRPRVYNDWSLRARYWRKLIGLHAGEFFQHYLVEANRAKYCDFSFEDHSIYVRWCRLPGEQWLILADPLEPVQRTITDKA